MALFLMVGFLRDLMSLLVGNEANFMLFSHVLHSWMVFDIIFGRRVNFALVECFYFFFDFLELILTIVLFLFVPPHDLIIHYPCI
jgi:hypothetical protein